MLLARLMERVRASGCRSFTEYHRDLKGDPAGDEIRGLVNFITTNRTEFFREAHHFTYLRQVWAPAFAARVQASGDRRVRVWSAACSSGEEAYSIAVTLADALADVNADVRILASDIDTDVLARAEAGVYSLDDVASVPPNLLVRYFLKGVGANEGLVRIRPEVEALVTFRRVNLLDRAWPIRTRFDVIFCRNTLIYFDRATQRRVLEHLVEFLDDDGLLVLGHSENVHGLVDGFRHVERTIYQRETTTPEPSRRQAHARDDPDRR